MSKVLLIRCFRNYVLGLCFLVTSCGSPQPGSLGDADEGGKQKPVEFWCSEGNASCERFQKRGHRKYLALPLRPAGVKTLWMSFRSGDNVDALLYRFDNKTEVRVGGKGGTVGFVDDTNDPTYFLKGGWFPIDLERGDYIEKIELLKGYKHFDSSARPGDTNPYRVLRAVIWIRRHSGGLERFSSNKKQKLLRRGIDETTYNSFVYQETLNPKGRFSYLIAGYAGKLEEVLLQDTSLVREVTFLPRLKDRFSGYGRGGDPEKDLPSYVVPCIVKDFQICKQLSDHDPFLRQFL